MYAWHRMLFLFCAAIYLCDNNNFLVLAGPAISLSGFSIRPISPTIYSKGFLTNPTDLAFLPDGSFFVSEKRGTVRYFVPDRSLPNGYRAADNFTVDIRDIVDNSADRGLNSIAVDASTFRSDPWIYLYYVWKDPAATSRTKSTVMRVTRMPLVNMIGDRRREVSILGRVQLVNCTDADTRSPPIDCIPIDSVTHSACQVRVLADSTLWVTTGDGSDYLRVDPRALRALRVDSYLGKVLRVDRNGRGLATNPFYDGNLNSVRSKVYALGLRNPFRSVQIPGTPNLELFTSVVGWTEWESMYRIRRGDNGGWPCYEGSHVNEPYANLDECVALYAGRRNGTLRFPAYEYSHNGEQAAVMGGAITMGSAYGRGWANVYWFMDYVSGELKYFRPAANWGVTGNPTVVGNFNSPVGIHRNPYDDKLYVLTIWESMLYRIEYGAAQVTPGRTPTSVPPSPLFVTLVAPRNGARYSVGQTVYWACVARDVRGVTVASTLLVVNIYIHHCYPDAAHCHLHILDTVLGASSGTFSFPDHDDGSFIEVNCQAGQSQRGQASVYAYANTATFTTDSCLPNLPMTYSSFTGTAPFEHDEATVGGVRTVAIPGTFVESVTDHRYSFVAWSDCSRSTTRDFTIPSANSAAEAVYA